MISRFRPRRIMALVGLTLAWCGLWQEPSVANVVIGILLSVVVTTKGFGAGSAGGLRIRPLLKFGGLVLIDLARSTAGVAAEILTPTDRTQESIVAVGLPPEAGNHLLLLTIAITLTPGTAVVDSDPDRGVLYLHLLHHERRDASIAHAEELVRLACEALPSNSTEPMGATR